MSVKITYFVHGTTVDNENDLATGWAHGELSALGIEQSKKLRELVADKKFDVVLCSDLKRAVDTAQLAFGGTCEIVQDHRLREANYGDFTETPLAKFKDRLVDYIDHPFPHGESYKDVEHRLKEFLDFLKKQCDGKRVAVVAHQAPQLALDVLLRGKPWAQAMVEDWRHTKSWQPGWEYELK